MDWQRSEFRLPNKLMDASNEGTDDRAAWNQKFGDLCSPGQSHCGTVPGDIKRLVQSIFMTQEMTLLTTSLNRLFHQSSDLIIWILLL